MALFSLHRKLGLDTDDDGTKTQKQKQKYKIIAQTYAKRKELQDTGRLSVSFYEAHTDPAGLNFDINDLNSAATNEMSSTWCNYLPKIARRRSAIANSTTSCGAGGTGGGGGGPRKSSVDSEYSLSVRQFSVESRRNSMDSQVSVKIAEVQTKVSGMFEIFFSVLSVHCFDKHLNNLKQYKIFVFKRFLKSSAWLKKKNFFEFCITGNLIWVGKLAEI